MSQQTWWPQRTVVEHGDWEFTVLDSGVANVHFGGTRVLRAIEFVARDRNWRNIPLQLVERKLQSADAELSLDLTLENTHLEVTVTVKIVTVADELRVAAVLESAKTFETNRAGLTILHGPENAGQPLVIADPTGSTTQTQFPREIAPHQPAKNIRSLSWQVAGDEYVLDFSGDIFEMEDQRNWSDASYKTYSRPLDLPFPYVIQPGARESQEVALKAPVARRKQLLSSTTAGREPYADNCVQLAVTGVVPNMSVQVGKAWFSEQPISQNVPDEMAALGDIPRLLELDLDDGRDHWTIIEKLSKQFRLKLRLIGDASQVDFWHTLTANSAIVDLGIFGPSSHLTTQCSPAVLGGMDAAWKVVGGTRAHFTELNRNRNMLEQTFDKLVFSSTPLFHSEATQQIVEAVAIQRIIAQQTASLAPNRAIEVGPITLGPRFQNVATDMESSVQNYDYRGNPLPIDARFDAPEMAAWLVASTISMSVAGVVSLCYFEDWGEGGLMKTDGERRPVYQAFQTVRALIVHQVVSGSTSDGLLWAARINSSDEPGYLLANLDRVPRQVQAADEDSVVLEHLLAAGRWDLVDRNGKSLIT